MKTFEKIPAVVEVETARIVARIVPKGISRLNIITYTAIMDEVAKVIRNEDYHQWGVNLGDVMLKCGKYVENALAMREKGYVPDMENSLFKGIFSQKSSVLIKASSIAEASAILYPMRGKEYGELYTVEHVGVNWLQAE